MNKLGLEKSPYLLQHKNNPVNWFAWGQESFEAARSQNKPIFLSIGYSTCYWCHVMEKQCFEDQEVADALSRYFISIKLDREERPDLDQIYMDAVVGLTGHGGWPMSVFLTPDLKPFFGGTYFPKAQFIPLLEKIGEVWKQDQISILESSKQLEGYLLQAGNVSEQQDSTVIEIFRSSGEYFKRSFDETFGGFGGAPKFPQPSYLAFLFRLARRTASPEYSKMAAFTLEAICRGGIYDQLDGGFHRYAVDRAWQVPHFEKMLYDNAQLVSVLVAAYQSTKEEWCLKTAKKTLDYALTILENSSGAFFAAEDAGEVGSEGEFYVWKTSELKKLVSPNQLTQLMEVYGVTEEGNFEHGTNIFFLKGKFTDLVELEPVNQLLLNARNLRERPFKDKKIITSWNGLMISALAKVAGVEGDGPYLDSAKRAANFILSNLLIDSGLKRRFCDGEAGFDGVLEDYSFLIQGLLDLHEVSGDVLYFDSAVKLQSIQDSKFWDTETGSYFFSASLDVITRKKDYNDGATPSGNSVAALNLLRLHQLTGESSYKDFYLKLKLAMLPHARRYPGAFTTFLSALDYELEDERLAVIGGEESQSFATQLRQDYQPNSSIYLASDSGPLPLRGKQSVGLQIFICSNQGCSLPIDNLVKAIEDLKPTIMRLE